MNQKEANEFVRTTVETALDGLKDHPECTQAFINFCSIDWLIFCPENPDDAMMQTYSHPFRPGLVNVHIQPSVKIQPGQFKIFYEKNKIE